MGSRSNLMCHENFIVLYVLQKKVTKHKWCGLQAERQEVGQEPEKQTGYKARVNRNHANGATATSRKSFPALRVQDYGSCDGKQCHDHKQEHKSSIDEKCATTLHEAHKMT
jgi:hypothetical protein